MMLLQENVYCALQSLCAHPWRFS